MKLLYTIFLGCTVLLSCADAPEVQCDAMGISQAQDAMKLQQLFTEIEGVSTSVSCDDPSEWAFTAFGSKACGGTQGYIAYSTTIDVADFLERVRMYTETEDAFNQLWGVISDCALVNPPSSIICRDGLPVFQN